MNNSMKDSNNKDKTYCAPKMKVVEIAVRSILCQSLTRKGGAGIDGIDGEDNLDW